MKLPVPILPRAGRRSAVLALVLAALAAIGAGAPTFASAATKFRSGQLESWSKAWGAGEGEFFDPSMLAVNPENGNVFISDLLPDFEGTRVQEFTESGELIGETEPLVTDVFGQYAGMAMDPTTDEVYLLEGEFEQDSEPGMTEEIVATRILAFEATPTAGTKKLAPAADPVIGVPDANQPNTIFNPRELTLDPKTGDLIVLGENRQRQIVLQRIGTAGAGTIGAAYVDTSGALAPTGPVQGQLGIAVSENGTTYLLSSFGGLQTEIKLHTLPAEFTAASTLTSMPGIEAAATAEQWGTTKVSMEPPETFLFPGRGAQLAVSSAPDGSGETLYFKVEAVPVLGNVPGVYYVRGYSLVEQSTTVGYGGGTGGECGIQGSRASLAALSDGSLDVLDQAPQFESAAESPPNNYVPWLSRFGPEVEEEPDIGALACPVPAAAFGIEAGGHPVSGPPAEVPAGTTVKLTGESQLASQTLSGTSWKIEGPEDVTGADATLEHKFLAAGTYTLRMKVQTSPVASIGTTFSAPPRTLIVTAATSKPKFPLNVTKSGTGTGTVTSTPSGISCGTTCSAEFEEGEEVTLTEVPASGSEFGAWSGACTGTGVCKVPMSAAESVSAEFKLESGTPPHKFPLAVTKSGTGSGIVTSTPAGINCGTTCSGEFDEGEEVTLTEAPASGSEFGGWSGACTGTGVCKVSLSAAATVNAEFKTAATPEFTLSVTPGGTGTGTVKCNSAVCATKYPAGTRITLTAIAGSGASFAGWSGAGCSGTGICVVTIEAATTVSATFTANPPSSNPNNSNNSNSSNNSSGNSGSTGGSTATPGGGATHPGGGGKTTPAQKLKEKQQKAIAKCKKLKGKAKAQCTKKAHQIGKPKKKAKKGKAAARELVLPIRWDAL